MASEEKKIIPDDDWNVAPSEIFSDAELLSFKEVLLAEKKKILDNAKAAIKAGSMKLEKDEMMDEVDLASATIEQNLTFRLLDRERLQLVEVEHALEKLKYGDFGFCEGTGEAIPKRRLEITPWTRHSVKHKEQLEKMQRSGRMLEDDSFA